MNAILIAIITGVFSSFLASIIFILYQKWFTPKLEISNTLAKGANLSGRKAFKFKVLNKGRRSVINVQAELHILYHRMVNGRVRTVVKSLPLKKSKVFQITPKLEKVHVNRFEKDTDEFIFLTYEDLDTLWTDKDHFIRLRVYGIDSYSGKGKVFVQYYHLDNGMKVGEFKVGSSMEVV